VATRAEALADRHQAVSWRRSTLTTDVRHCVQRSHPELEMPCFGHQRMTSSQTGRPLTDPEYM